jgi:hypothetical protein
MSLDNFCTSIETKLVKAQGCPSREDLARGATSLEQHTLGERPQRKHLGKEPGRGKNVQKNAQFPKVVQPRLQQNQSVAVQIGPSPGRSNLRCQRPGDIHSSKGNAKVTVAQVTSPQGTAPKFDGPAAALACGNK